MNHLLGGGVAFGQPSTLTHLFTGALKIPADIAFVVRRTIDSQRECPSEPVALYEVERRDLWIVENKVDAARDNASSRVELALTFESLRRRPFFISPSRTVVPCATLT